MSFIQNIKGVIFDIDGRTAAAHMGTELEETLVFVDSL